MATTVVLEAEVDLEALATAVVLEAELDLEALATAVVLEAELHIEVLATAVVLESEQDLGRSEDGPGMKDGDLDRVQIPEEDDSKEGSETKTDPLHDFGFR